MQEVALTADLEKNLISTTSACSSSKDTLILFSVD